jgi:hypothetical protein
MTAAALPRKSTKQAASTLKYGAISHSESEFASNQQEEAAPLQRRKDLPSASSMVRFQRLLAKIEIANTPNSCKRLSEQWEGDDDDLKAEFDFETTLWALVGLEKICAIAESNYLKSMPGYCVSGGSMVKIQDGMDILHLGPVHGKQTV